MWVIKKGASSVISCRVSPNASKEGIGEIKNESLIIKLHAPAIEGKANEALIKFLSKRLGIAKSKINIIHGEKNRNKLVSIEGLSPEEIEEALGVICENQDPT